MTGIVEDRLSGRGRRRAGAAGQKLRKQAPRRVGGRQHDRCRGTRTGLALLGEAAAVVERLVVRQLVQDQLETAAPERVVPNQRGSPSVPARTGAPGELSRGLLS